MPVKISDLDPSNTITANDLIQIIDVDDGTMGASGTNKRVTAGEAANQFGALFTTVPTIVATELNTKAPISNPIFIGNVVLPDTTSIGPVNSTQIGYLSGVTSNIQTQLNGKISAASPAFTGTPTSSNNNAQSLTSGALHCTGGTGAILIDDAGHKRISWNDGAGNFNIRSGHYQASSGTLYAKGAGDSNGGAARMTMDTDGTNGTVTISAAASGTPGTAVTWANNLVLNKDYLYTDKKFGIGTGTSTPDAVLTVVASTTDNNPANNGIRVVNFGTNLDDNAYLAVHTNSATGGDPVVSWDINGVAGWCAGIDNSDSDKFKISSNWNDLANNTRITIQHSNGFIGIGKTNPDTALDVNGTITATSFSGTATNATNAGYATSAGTANYANSAGSATNAGYATSAGSATSAGYATSAGSANYATSAGSTSTVSNGGISASKLDGGQTGPAPVYGVRAYAYISSTNSTNPAFTVNNGFNSVTKDGNSNGKYVLTLSHTPTTRPIICVTASSGSYNVSAAIYDMSADYKTFSVRTGFEDGEATTINASFGVMVIY